MLLETQPDEPCSRHIPQRPLSSRSRPRLSFSSQGKKRGARTSTWIVASRAPGSPFSSVLQSRTADGRECGRGARMLDWASLSVTYVSSSGSVRVLYAL